MERILFWLALPLLGGVVLAAWLPSPAWPALAAACACAGLGCLRRRVAPLALGAACFLLGWGLPGSTPMGPRLQGSVRVWGEIRPGAMGRRAELALRAVADSAGPWRPTRGRVVLVFHERAPAPGQELLVWGRAGPAGGALLPGEPESSQPRSLSRSPSQLRVRRWQLLGGSPSLAPRFPEGPHQGLIMALAVGDRSQVPDEVLRLLRRTGTSHLLAISGLHLGLVAAAAGAVLARAACFSALLLPSSHQRAWGALGMVLAVLLYGGMARWPVSAMRAAAMVGCGSLAWALERGRDPWQLLGAAAIITVLVEPGCVTTPGWQLSFGAVLGMLLAVPRLTRLLPPDLPRGCEWVLRAVIVSLAAILGTLPAAAWWFQDLAPVAVLANLLALPLVGMLATPCALAAGLLPGLAGQLAAALAAAALELVLWWLRLIDGPCWHPAVGPAGAALLLAALCLPRRPGLAGSLALLALGLRVMPRARLVLTFLSVGQGDAMLAEWPDGRRWLVDGGPSSQQVLRYLRRRGIRSLDVVALSHPHPDHMGGLGSVLDELAVDSLWLPRMPLPGEEEFSVLVGRAWAAGVSLALPGDPAMPALHPLTQPMAADVNDHSLVLRLRYGWHSFLLTGDIGAAVERALAPGSLAADVLKLPHHGSRGSSSMEFVQAVGARVAVISCGADNPFGHPHPEVLARYRAAALYRTDLHGTVEVSSDGAGLSVRCWLPGRGWHSRKDPASGTPALLRSVYSPASSSASSSPSSESSRNR